MAKGLTLSEVRDELMGLRNELDNVVSRVDQEIASSAPTAEPSWELLQPLMNIVGKGAVMRHMHGPFVIHGECWPADR
jgi:hypothetical protein